MTGAELIDLNLRDRQAFLRLLPVMRLHVLTCKQRESHGSLYESQIWGAIRAGFYDEAELQQIADAGEQDVYPLDLVLQEVGKQLLVIAAGSIKDALNFFYCRAFEVELAQAWAEVRQAKNQERGESERSEQVADVTVLVVGGRQLEELRQTSGRYAPKHPAEADDGCELFRSNELAQILKQRREEIHTPTLTH